MGYIWGSVYKQVFFLPLKIGIGTPKMFEFWEKSGRKKHILGEKCMVKGSFWEKYVLQCSFWDKH